ncbi:P-loop containing nucleoside triphosphate hydrolase protein, partial [Thamnocephalis sphaerospora]
ENVARIDAMNRPTYLLSMVNQWLSCRLYWISSLAVLVCCIILLVFQNRLGAGLSGLVLSLSLMFGETIGWVIREYSRLEMAMNGMKRVVGHLQVEQESEKKDEVHPADSWPHRGRVRVKNLFVWHTWDQRLVLRNITLDIRPGLHIAVVGAAGSGKSVLSAAFLRFVEASRGRIVIDGIDISKISLRDLRSRLAVIPQDPALFNGTIRSNLDPLLVHDDAEIWRALRRCRLIGQDDSDEPVHGFESLDVHVSNNGLEYSQVQRQLLLMARALLRNSKVIVMDEGPVAADADANSEVQSVLRREFTQSTVLYITDRLRAVMSYDRVVVLDAGRVVEYGEPPALAMRHGSALRRLCERMGDADLILSRM